MRLLTTTAILGLLAAKAMAAPPQIVTDIPVTGSLAQQVLGDLGEVRVLIGDGADPHHFQLKPSDAAALQSAGLLVWIGPEMTPWLERAADNLGDGSSLSLLTVPGTHLQEFGAEGDDHAEHAHDDHDHEHEHEHEHEHDEEHGHDHNDGHGHSHDGTDPHAWLDPHNAQTWLTAIARELATQDPENAETYAANAEASVKQIGELEAQLNAQLEPVKDRPFAVFHDAYGYFTAHFGLLPGIAVSLGDASAPSAARLSEISAQIADSGAECAFPEYGHKQALIQSAIEGSDARIGAELDPAGRGIEAGAGLYAEMLQNMGDALAECLSGKG
ncbi:zinc ABC transporter substrate-binding protein [Paracoccus onubensis]|uniref:High-affinity zinc uptake system protein ZnuA n=1 Tax=Paracoccus onubensis TaxID=1675788 RepID=A0A418T8I7_9RHOB|nr:zinc ABC transporter substrate-binding protein [Paracoccus onubensis]RJE89420.1 zinc ABC transporter substrate-binding protein [Paracoccus onubensis]